MRRSRPLLVLVLAAAAAAGVPAAAQAELTGRLLVSMAPAAPGAPAATAAATAVAAAAGARLSGPIVPQIGLVTVRPRRGETLAALAARLRAEPRVRAVSVDHRATLRALPDDPALTTPETAPGTAPGTPVEWWALAERFPQAWAITQGKGATVAIVDTGVDATHPELASQIVAKNDEDPTSKTGAGVDASGHGTHVASLACARANNGIGIAGAGYGCGLIVEKTDLSDAANIAAIVDAADRGADAINMSFGADPDPVTGTTPAPSQALEDALRYARSKGSVLVAAAADQPITNQGDPANVLQPTGTGPDLGRGLGLSVTAAQANGTRASFAGLGTQISIAAYGAYAQDVGPPGLLGAFPPPTVGIELSDPGSPPTVPATPGCDCRTTFGGDQRYAYLAGTSMAVPQVAATAALMRHLNPDLPPALVERLLKQTASRPAGVGWTEDLGWGILDAGAALTAARDTDRTPPVATVRLVRRSADAVEVRVTAHDPAPAGVRASGVRSVALYRTVDGRRVSVPLSSSGTATLRGRPGATLLLTARATDRAGNRQRLPARPTLRVRVTS